MSAIELPKGIKTPAPPHLAAHSERGRADVLIAGSPGPLEASADETRRGAVAFPGFAISTQPFATGLRIANMAAIGRSSALFFHNLADEVNCSGTSAPGDVGARAPPRRPRLPRRHRARPRAPWRHQRLTAAGTRSVAHVLAHVCAGAAAGGSRGASRRDRQFDRFVRRRDLRDQLAESQHFLRGFWRSGWDEGAGGGLAEPLTEGCCGGRAAVAWRCWFGHDASSLARCGTGAGAGAGAPLAAWRGERACAGASGAGAGRTRRWPRRRVERQLPPEATGHAAWSTGCRTTISSPGIAGRAAR